MNLEALINELEHKEEPTNYQLEVTAKDKYNNPALDASLDIIKLEDDTKQLVWRWEGIHLGHSFIKFVNRIVNKLEASKVSYNADPGCIIYSGYFIDTPRFHEICRMFRNKTLEIVKGSYNDYTVHEQGEL